MRIYEIYDSGISSVLPNYVPDFIQSTEWYLILREYFDDLLLQLKGDYKINLPRLKGNYKDLTSVVNNISDIIRLHLVSHFYEYNGLYETTQLEYNPIWNVDGTVITENERLIDTSASGINNHTGNDKTVRKGDDTNNHTGNDINALSGTDKDNNEQVISETPMDSDTLLTKEKTVNNGSVIYGKTSTDTYNSQNKTEYNSTDTVTYDSGNSHNDVSEEQDKFNETVTRQGNIGITSTQSLIGEQREIVNFSFLEYVVNNVTPRFTITGGIATL